MIDPRPLDPPSYWEPDHEELVETVLLHELLEEDEAREAETFELLQLLKDFYQGW